jgi:hypothetical protein
MIGEETVKIAAGSIPVDLLLIPGIHGKAAPAIGAPRSGRPKGFPMFRGCLAACCTCGFFCNLSGKTQKNPQYKGQLAVCR